MKVLIYAGTIVCAFLWGYYGTAVLFPNDLVLRLITGFVGGFLLGVVGSSLANTLD